MDRENAVAGSPDSAVAGDQIDVPGLHHLAVEGARAGRHHADPVVARVGHHQVPRTVHRHRTGLVEFGGGGRATVAGEPGRAVAGDRVDVPGGHCLAVEGARAGRHHADPVVARVGHHQAACLIDGDRAPAYLGLGRRATVPEHPAKAGPGHGRQVVGARVHHPHRGGLVPRPAVRLVRDVHMAAGVRRSACMDGHRRGLRGAADAACHGRDGPGRGSTGGGARRCRRVPSCRGGRCHQRRRDRHCGRP